MSDAIPPVETLVISREFYPASGGTECFIKATHPDTGAIVGYVRLRKPSPLVHRKEIARQASSIIRELRVVGEVVPVSEIAGTMQAQHRGLGKRLVGIAESIAFDDFSSEKLLVIAGLGVRSYFHAIGYRPDGPYVSKLKKE